MPCDLNVTHHPTEKWKLLVFIWEDAFQKLRHTVLQDFKQKKAKNILHTKECTHFKNIQLI